MSLAVGFRAFTCALLFGLLAGCNPGRDVFPPVCPRLGFPAATGDVSAYRPGTPGAHLTDLVYSGRMMGIQGQCKLDPDNKYRLQATVQLTIEVTRGPALQGRQVAVPVYLAVTEGTGIEGTQILNKRVFMMRGVFPPNVDRINITTPEIEILLPISPTKSGAAYSILAGFQLTAQQWEAVRARPRQ